MSTCRNCLVSPLALVVGILVEDGVVLITELFNEGESWWRRVKCHGECLFFIQPLCLHTSFLGLNPVKHGDITEDMTSSMNKVIDNIKSSIKDLIGDDPQVEYHYGLDAENGEGDAGTMYIDMSNNIFVSGRQV